MVDGKVMDEETLCMNLRLDEAKTTRRVFARIPEGSDYKRDLKSRTAHEILAIVCEEKMIYGPSADEP